MSTSSDADKLEVAPAVSKDQLEGWIPALASEAEIQVAFEKAFNYRGDVTITKKDGAKLECYVFDRKAGKTLADSVVRVIPKESFEKLSIPYSEIAGLAFTGRDTAAGKSWEAWVRKYWEKKNAGEKNIALAPDTIE
ncbi:MAG TPA: hypothetical protein VGL53_13400 [Bryobacteraceae bacterium]